MNFLNSRFYWCVKFSFVCAFHTEQKKIILFFFNNNSQFFMQKKSITSKKKTVEYLKKFGTSIYYKKSVLPEKSKISFISEIFSFS